jgi:heptaprenyl diphosphate synthase
MVLLKKINRFSEVGVSVAGGVAHNVGQIIAAVFIMQTSAIAYYLPVLMVSGIVTGVVIGIVAALIVRRVEKLTRK